MFILSEISPTLNSEVHNLATPNIWTFCPQKPKNLNLMNSLLTHYSWPIQIQKDPKDPNLKFIFTMKLLHSIHILLVGTTCGWFVSATLFWSLKIELPTTAQPPQITWKVGHFWRDTVAFSPAPLITEYSTPKTIRGPKPSEKVFSSQVKTVHGHKLIRIWGRIVWHLPLIDTELLCWTIASDQM